MRTTFAFVAFVILSPFAVADSTDVYLIRVVNGTVGVETLEALPAKEARGLLVWTENGREQWKVLRNDNWLAEIQNPPPAPPAAAIAYARGTRGEASGGNLSGFGGTVQLPPANLSGVLRGAPFLTPVANAVVLSDRPVIRRVGSTEKKDSATLSDAAGKVVAVIEFAAGEVAARTPASLPAGEYRLKGSGPEFISFTVADAARVKAETGRADWLAELVGAKSPVASFVRVEELLARREPSGPRKGMPVFLGDVLDHLEALPEAELTPYLKQQRDRLRAWATSLATDTAPPTDATADDSPTGIPAVDAARAAISGGRVRDAEKLLNAATPKDPRGQALVALYKASVLAEGGAARADEAEEQFQLAIAGATAAADKLRVHNNYADFLHRQAQDRINNHALQMAAGVDRPISSALRAWTAAAAQYELATAVAGPKDKPAVLVNRARLIALLADVIETLDLPIAGKRQAADLSGAAVTNAKALADAVPESEADAATRATGREVLAYLELRDNHADAAGRQAALAANEYATLGSLTGVEAAFRLSGQAARAKKDDALARRQLLAAYLLGELLRERLPTEATGTTHAGFFARRAYILDALVELEITAGNDVAALEYAEKAKARAMQDLLFERADRFGRGRSVPEILKAWPKDTVAVEYFFGRDAGYVFVIANGEVKAKKLAIDSPREFLTSVQKFLRGIEGYAQQMLNRHLAGKGFDNAWEQTLFEFGTVLLPDEVRAAAFKPEIKTVVIVPQHLLHYFPFPALVIEKDKQQPVTKDRVARPQFLADRPFALVNAPSVTTWDTIRSRKAPPVMNRVSAVGLVQAPGEAPLPGVETDLENMKAAFDPKMDSKVLRDVLTGENATARKALLLLEQPGLIVLATHGFNEADRPLESFMVLLPDPQKGGDGKLRASDVFASKSLRADVVVMSACYTGLGDRSPLPGDDLFGLQRAFLQAGRRTVLAGLWDVYDGTAPELMGACMTKLAAGVPIAAAVADSRRDFLNKYSATGKAEPYLHPYFWAVYSLLGDERPYFEVAK